MKLIIKGELTDLNTYVQAERGNRYAAASIKEQETERVRIACIQQKIQPILTCSVVSFVWYHKDKRKDFDNVEFAQKFIWDGLVLAKVLKGDGQRYTPNQRSHTHKVNKENPRVEILIV